MTHPLQPSVGSAVESKQHVVRRDIPVLQTYGPQQVHDLDGGQFGFAETVADYVEKLKDEPNTLDEGVQAIWHIFQQSTVRARDLRLLLNRIVVEIMGTMDEEDPAEAPLMHYLDNLLDAVAAVWSGKWLLGHLHGFVEMQEIGRGTLDAAQEEIANLEQQPAFPDRLPRPLTSKQLVFLHLFSGFRRCGDVQEAVETIAAAHQLDVKALSVDVVISLKHGDLLRTDTKNCFLEAVRAKWVTGLIAGPPCETWSVARESVLEGAPGPKPVRTVESPQGMDLLSLRELKQVLVGNRLLGVAVLFMVACWIADAFAAFEHPTLPKSDNSPSIKRLPALILLEKQRQVVRTCIYQGLYGAKSPKPTDLLLIHPPEQYEAILVEYRSTDRMPLARSIGRNVDGSFQTADLKTYPKALCEAISALWCAKILNCQPGVQDSVFSDTFCEVIAELHSTIGDGAQGPDFCRDGIFIAV